MAVVGGLSNSILERMHKTKECLSNEDKLVCGIFQEISSSLLNLKLSCIAAPQFEK